MNNDLISRSVLLKALEEKVYPEKYGEKCNALDVINGVLQVIGEQPTAYDEDKVVKQLEENAKYFQSEADELAKVGDFGTATELQGKAAAYRDAVKTVRPGGIE